MRIAQDASAISRFHQHSGSLDSSQMASDHDDSLSLASCSLSVVNAGGYQVILPDTKGHLTTVQSKLVVSMQSSTPGGIPPTWMRHRSHVYIHM